MKRLPIVCGESPSLLSDIAPPVHGAVDSNHDQRVPRGSLVGPTAERAWRHSAVRSKADGNRRKSQNVTFSLTTSRDPRRSDSDLSRILRFMCAEEIGERKQGGP